MSNTSYLIFLSLAIGALTVASRWVGLIIMRKCKNVPLFIETALNLIPVAVFASLIFPTTLKITHNQIPELENFASPEVFSALILVLGYKFTKKPYLAFSIAAIFYLVIKSVL